jgi:intein-encoded DNA endonuclease-like protein
MVIPRESRVASAKRELRRDYTLTPQITKSYLLGILHDATERKTTYRIATKSLRFARILIKSLKKLGKKSWLYREGKTRHLWIVEFSKSFLKGAEIKTKQDKIDYVRGYFDAEGGIAKSSKVNFYLYLAQKNKTDLLKVKKYLEELGIACGKTHNPSQKADPNYWRFFVRAKSYHDFAGMIFSNHPEKQRYLRMKI